MLSLALASLAAFLFIMNSSGRKIRLHIDCRRASQLQISLTVPFDYQAPVLLTANMTAIRLYANVSRVNRWDSRRLYVEYLYCILDEINVQHCRLNILFWHDILISH